VIRRLAIAAAMLLAACGQKSQPPGSNVVAGTPPKVAAETAGANSGANAAAANETGVVPPANAAMRYVGTWARSKADCASKPWRFTAKSLKAKDGPQCSFYNVAKAPGGYDIGAECPTKQPIHEDLIKLRFGESAGAMLVESNAIPPTGLVYCGK
jgi:hypothetical protein